MWKRLRGNECVHRQKCLVERLQALRLAASQQDLDASMSTVTNAKIHYSQPPFSLIIQAFTNNSHIAESKRPTPINCLVRHLYRACPRVSDLSLEFSRPAFCSWRAHTKQNYSKMGHLFFLSMDCFGFHCLATGSLHTCARYRCFAGEVVQSEPSAPY